MAEPRLTVLGVYRPQITKQTWQEQWRVIGDDEATHKHFENLVLIEAVVEGLTERFEMGKFGQMQLDHPNDARHMQVAYDEALLSADGELLIQREMNCVHGTGPLRFAAYLHLYDPNRSLKWQYGEVNCPAIQDAPVRLMVLVPYRACT